MMNNYGTLRIELVQGKGAIVADSEGKEYLDLLAGIAVNALGHAHPAIVEAVSKQTSTMGHVSNISASEPPLASGEKLIELTGWDTDDTRVMFCNSGTEADEAAFKLARLTGRNHIIATHHGFHGRTVDALAMTGQPDKHAPFKLMPGGIEFVPYGDIGFLTRTIESDPLGVTAVILEPIQGETGMVAPPEGYLAAVRELTKRFDVLMIVDEVQTGIGRTGQWFAHQHDDIVPDVMTLIKGLGGDLPLDAVIANGRAAELFTPGTRGATFGGNPICAATGLAVIETLEEERLLNRVTEKGKALARKLASLSHVDHVRGHDFTLGLVLCENLAKGAVNAGYERGVILNAPQANILRVVPPLNLSDEEVNRVVELIDACLNDTVEAVVSNGRNQELTLRHFLADGDLAPWEQAEVLQLAVELKTALYSHRPFEGPQSVAMLFDRASTRTRFLFDAGITTLGGNAIMVETGNSQMGKGETYRDTAAVLNRFVSAIVWRTYAQSGLEAMSKAATVPIVNALSDESHPCRTLADLQTIIERKYPEEGQAGLRDKKAVYFGDGANNMASSYLVGFATAGLDVTICAPEDFQPEQGYVDRAKKVAGQTGAAVSVTTDVDEAIAGAGVVVTDTWVSMSQENDGLDRRTPFLPYQVNAELMAKANEDATFLRCLSAYRGNEVTAEAIDGPQSVVFDETENRIHAQKALPIWPVERQ